MSPVISPLTPAIGAVVSNLDLSQSLNPSTAGFLNDALAQHGVLFFRGQNLDIGAQIRLTAAFGPVQRLPYVTPMADHPDVIRVLKEADEGGGVFGGDWHQDFSFLETPPRGAILQAIEVPPVGGDTVWTSQISAYRTLPERLKSLLTGQDALHVGKPYGVRWAPPQDTRSGMSIQMSRGDPSADVERAHPTVLRQPKTERHGLFLNPLYVSRLSGLTEDQSRPMLEMIQAHTIRPEHQCRWRWKAGDIAIWDNFFTQHYAINDYFGHRREMWRTTFGGETPQALAA